MVVEEDVIPLLTDDDTNVRTSAIETLGNIRSKKAIEKFSELFDENEELQNNIIDSAGKIGGEEAEHFLLDLMDNSNDEFVKILAMEALAYCGSSMDVVKTNIQKLKGMVDIDSEMGKGTTFSIKLPLTLAIIQGLLVMVEDETYAIPLSSVEEVVSLEESEISTINSQEVIRIRENVYPIMRLNSVLGLEDTGDPEDKNVVLLGVGIERIGLVVDKLLGQQEIVIKSLGKYLGSVKGLAGSSILGDGRVIMIIDVAEMVQEFYAKN